MKVSSYADRLGGFVSSNAGRIADCYTDAKIKYKNNAAGFVFENGGEIERCVAQKSVKGKTNIAGFCFRNNGTLKNSGFMRAENSKKTKAADEKFAVEYKDIAEVYEKLSLSDPWIAPEKGDSRLDFSDDILSFPVENPIEISSAEELFMIASDIATGDAEAASANYVLVKDINLRGKKWIPIGASDTTPFTGKFNGNGHRVYNFKIEAKGLPFAGFFGVVKGCAVVNFTVDCVVNAADGAVVGGMCGQNDNGTFYNCKVIAKIAAQKICGGFCGKNKGHIEKCAFIGSVSPVVPFILIVSPFLAGIAALLIIGIIILVLRLNKNPYTPEIIDPNQRPVTDTGHVEPPPAGSSRISIECNQEVYVNVASGVGIINYVNPRRSSLDVMIKVVISDAELMKTIGKTGRKTADQAALEADPNYDPASTYQELYVSGRLQIGYMIEAIKLGTLADGTMLPVGDYEMLVTIDAYDPVTFEKAVVNARAPVTVHIVESDK